MYKNPSFAKEYRYLMEWDPSDTNCVIPSFQVVTCFLQNNDNFLVLQRARKDQQHQLWGIPGGKLDKNEKPISGLIRELKEEIGIQFSNEQFKLLGTALSRTPSDGLYGLYLYHAYSPADLHITINLEEHYAFQWVTLEEFIKLDLLTAQGEAFRLVENQLKCFLLSKENL